MIKKTFYIDLRLYYILKELKEKENINLKNLISNILTKELPIFKPIHNKKTIIFTKKKLQVSINEMINKDLQNTSKKYNLAQSEIIRQILSKYVFDNYFIKFDKPLYFNIKELFDKKETTATDKAPINNLHEYYIIFGIPNNLDTFNKKYNTYCYNNNLNKHKGFLLDFFSNKLLCKPSEMEYKYFYFDLTLNNDKPVLNIKLFDIDELFLYINNNNDAIETIKFNLNQIDRLFSYELSFNLSFKNWFNYIFNKSLIDLNNAEINKEITCIINVLLIRFLNRNLLKPYKVHNILNYYITILEKNNEKYIKETYLYVNDNMIKTIRVYLNELKDCINPMFINCNYEHYFKCMLLIECFLNKYYGVKPISY